MINKFFSIDWSNFLSPVEIPSASQLSRSTYSISSTELGGDWVQQFENFNRNLEFPTWEPQTIALSHPQRYLRLSLQLIQTRHDTTSEGGLQYSLRRVELHDKY